VRQRFDDRKAGCARSRKSGAPFGMAVNGRKKLGRNLSVVQIGDVGHEMVQEWGAHRGRKGTEKGGVFGSFHRVIKIEGKENGKGEREKTT